MKEKKVSSLKEMGRSLNIFFLGENFLTICFVSLEIQ